MYHFKFELVLIVEVSSFLFQCAHLLLIHSSRKWRILVTNVQMLAVGTLIQGFIFAVQTWYHLPIDSRCERYTSSGENLAV
ncbi:hypothetical protein BC629DRAFT_74899 [Irpex lacteus]|nr:hypothetical protein BC629DRAFT_74899 [Irpex lacteus]